MRFDNLLPRVAASLLFLTSFTGVVVSFMLDADVLPWTTVAILCYFGMRIERTIKMLESIPGTDID